MKNKIELFLGTEEKNSSKLNQKVTVFFLRPQKQLGGEIYVINIYKNHNFIHTCFGRYAFYGKT